MRYVLAQQLSLSVIDIDWLITVINCDVVNGGNAYNVYFQIVVVIYILLIVGKVDASQSNIVVGVDVLCAGQVESHEQSTVSLDVVAGGREAQEAVEVVLHFAYINVVPKAPAGECGTIDGNGAWSDNVELEGGVVDGVAERDFDIGFACGRFSS